MDRIKANGMLEWRLFTVFRVLDEEIRPKIEFSSYVTRFKV